MRGSLMIVLMLLTGALTAGNIMYDVPFNGDDLPRGAIDDIGNWTVKDGVLRQTDLEAHPALIFFPGRSFGDFEMSVEFNIRNTPTQVRAADLIFRAQDTSTFYYFHIDTQNKMVAFARAQDGNYWMDVVRAMDNPITLDTWHKARIIGKGDSFTIWIDGKERLTTKHDALAAGCVGLGTASAEVRFRGLKVTGTEAKLAKGFQRGVTPRIRVARHQGPGLPDFAPSLCRVGNRLLLAYSTAAVRSSEEGDEPKPGAIMLTESNDEGLTWSNPRMVSASEDDARDPVLSALPDGSVLLVYRTSNSPDLRLMVSGDGTNFKPLGTINLPGARLICRQPAFETDAGNILLPLTAIGDSRQGVLIAKSIDGGRNWLLGPVRWRRIGKGTSASSPKNSHPRPDSAAEGMTSAVIQSARGDLLMVSSPNLKLLRSRDMGERWRPTGKSLGIGGEPTLFRTAGRTLLLAYRRDPFGVHVMRCLDEEKDIWQGPIIVATNPGRGAISLADLADGRVLCAYSSDSPRALFVGVMELDHPQLMPGLFGGRAKWPEAHEGIVAPAWTRNNRNTEGSIIRLKDGSFLLAYTRFYGGGADHSPADVSAFRSFDDGKTWEGPFLMQPNDGGCMVGSVSLLRLQSGRILWGYARKDTMTNLCRFFVRKSSDEGKTWTREVCATPQMAYHVVNNDRVKQLSSGRLLVPTAMIPDWRGGFEDMGLEVFYSDDEGETWQTSGQVLHLKGSAQEPGVIELKDGRVMMICRTTLGQIYKCYSSDGGETFSQLEPMGVIAPCSPCSIRRIPTTGDLLLIFSDSRSARVPHASMISRDEGETWENLRHIEPVGNSFAYTSVFFWDDMSILSYWNSSPAGLSLKVKRLPISWYYGPEVSAEQSVNVREREKQNNNK